MTLFTSLCLICDAHAEPSLPICHDCLDEFPRVLLSCHQCGLTLEETTQTICGKCQTQPPPYTRTVAPFSYEDAIKHLIIELKFKKKLINAHLLGKLLSQHIINTSHPLPDFLLPVPLHNTRIRKRGFNQAMEICRVLSKDLSIPIISNTVKKVKESKPQAKLTAKQRQKNLRNCFTLAKDIPADANIAIVDDVITTGTTITEIGKLLKKSGASDLQAWACARTL